MKKNVNLHLLFPLLLLAAITIGSHVSAQTKLSQGRPVVDSTTEAGYPPSNAVDGNTSTKWSSSSSGYKQWLYVNLQDTFDINYVIIKWADGRYATTFDIQGANTVGTWITLKTVDSNTVNANSIDTIAGLKGNYKYVRFLGRGRANPAGYRIAEFEVYGTPPTTALQQISIDTLTRRLQSTYNAVVLDANAQTNVNNWMGSMLPDGSFSGINYNDVSGLTSWAPYRHLSRLKTMVYAYSTSFNPLYHNTTLRDKITLGLRFFFYRNPYSTSWYIREIGAPDDYMVVALMLKGQINNDSLLLYSSYLVDRSGQGSYEAANRAWAAEIAIHKGVIENRFAIANTAFSNMASTLDIKTTQGPEGIKSDYTIHVHNTYPHDQLFSVGYGGSMLADNTSFIRLSLNTDFINVFTPQRRSALVNATLKGNQILGYRKAADWGAAGRYIARRDGIGNFGTQTLDQIMINEPASATALQAYKDHINGAAFPTAFQGHRHLWKSDIMTKHGANYYLSAKIISQRSCGTESLNGENVKGNNLPLGATNIMTTGNEYKNIFPMWDWTRVPGTTAELNQSQTALATYLFGTNAFGGGVSDTVNGGVLAYEHNYSGVAAKKAYFFMGDALVCLGTGITANKSNTIATSVNQCFLSGPVTTYDGSSTQTFTGTSQMFNNLQWVHHDNVGYLFPNSGYMALEAKTQSGRWKDINLDYADDTLRTANIFSMWVNHSATPSNRSYYYIVMPDKTLSAFQTAVINHGFTVASNDANIQAVRNSVQQNYGVVFYNPGTVDMGDGLTITSDKKALVYIHKYSTNYKITVADPLYSQSSASIKINKQLTGSNASYANGVTTINVNFPSGDATGQTVTGFYTIVNNSPNASQPLTATVEGQETDGNSELKIYPNPVIGQIHISGLQEPALLKVFGADGTVLMQQKAKSLNIKSLPAGTYLLQINDDKGGITTRRFIKK